jgi:flagellar protein FlgJ
MLEAQLSQRLNAAPPEESEASEMANSVANSVAAAASISDRAANLSPDAALLNAGFLSAGLLDFLAAQERTPAASTAPKSATGAGEGSADFATPRAFAGALWSDAVEAGRNTGIPPQFLIAHAALESGWGRRNLKNADGSPSYNLFGIKAGGNWQGKTTDVVTTEYVHGAPVRQTERFRAYDSYAESFADYAQLLRDSPRYGSVIGSQNGTEFARRLQQAGYATDPKYAEKLAGIINGPTLRDALLG